MGESLPNDRETQSLDSLERDTRRYMAGLYPSLYREWLLQHSNAIYERACRLLEIHPLPEGGEDPRVADAGGTPAEHSCRDAVRAYHRQAQNRHLRGLRQGTTGNGMEEEMELPRGEADPAGLRNVQPDAESRQLRSVSAFQAKGSANRASEVDRLLQLRLRARDSQD